MISNFTSVYFGGSGPTNMEYLSCYFLVVTSLKAVYYSPMLLHIQYDIFSFQGAHFKLMLKKNKDTNDSNWPKVNLILIGTYVEVLEATQVADKNDSRVF